MSQSHIIINPVSGSREGRSIAERTIKRLEREGLKYAQYLCAYRDHGQEIALNLPLAIEDRIIVVGGDGTIHEVINGIMSREDRIKVPLGIIPAGTGNSLVHDLDCLDVEMALEALSNGHTKPIDLLKMKDRESTIYAFNVIGLGLVATINRKAEKLRNWGGWRYNMATILSLFGADSFKISLEIDGRSKSFEGHLVIALNTAHTGNGLKMAPEALIDDGLMHVLIAHKMSRWGLLQAFIRIFKGTHLEHPLIEHYDAKTLEIRIPVHERLMIDGQDKGKSPVKVCVLPKALEIICP